MFRQYDHMVQTNTVVPPGADAAVLRVPDAAPRGLALAVDGNGRACYLDPSWARCARCLRPRRTWRASGPTPAAVTDCLNFANPERPEVFWTFRQAVEGIARACEALDVPVIGGNVSFYNESGEAIYPTPIVAMLGRLDDVRRHATPGWVRDGDLIVLLGGAPAWLDGSEYLATLHGMTAGRLREPDLLGVARVIRCTREAVAAGLVGSAHDCADGGHRGGAGRVLPARRARRPGGAARGGRRPPVRGAVRRGDRPDHRLAAPGVGAGAGGARPAAVGAGAGDRDRRRRASDDRHGRDSGSGRRVGREGKPAEAGGPWVDVALDHLRTAWEPSEDVAR